MKKETKSKLNRRTFLLAVGAGSTAAAAAIAGRVIATDVPETAASEDKRRGRGYRESAHVRSYYHTTKV